MNDRLRSTTTDTTGIINASSIRITDTSRRTVRFLDIALMEEIEENKTRTERPNNRWSVVPSSKNSELR